MTTPSTSTELVIPELAESKKLALITPESAVAVKATYLPFFTTFLELEKQSKEIAVNTPAAAHKMQMALRKVRVDADKERKKLGENARLYTDAVNEVYNLLEARLKPVEDRMFAIAKAEELAIKERAAKLKETRVAELTPYAAVTATDIGFYDLANMPEGQYIALKDSIKTAADAKIAADKKVEEDRIAAEAARVQREKELAAENARLAAEAAERQKALDDANRKAEEARKKAQAEADRLRKEADDKLAAERKKAADEAARVQKAADEKAAKERAERDAREKAEQAKRDAETKRIADERAKADAKASAERQRLAAEAEKARKETQRLLDEAKAREEAEKAQKAKEAEAARLASAAPDKAKLIAFAHIVRNLSQVNPKLVTPAGVKLSTTVSAQIERFAKWVEGEANKL